MSFDLLHYRFVRAQLPRAQKCSCEGWKPRENLFLECFPISYNWCMDNKMYLPTKEGAAWSLLCASHLNQFRHRNYWPIRSLLELARASVNHRLRKSAIRRGRQKLMDQISAHLLVIRWNDRWVIGNKTQIEINILFLSRMGQSERMWCAIICNRACPWQSVLNLSPVKCIGPFSLI